MNDLFTSTQAIKAYRLSWKFIGKAQRSIMARSWRPHQETPGLIRSTRQAAWIAADTPGIDELRDLADFFGKPDPHTREQGHVTPAEMTIGRAALTAFERPETLTVEVPNA